MSGDSGNSSISMEVEPQPQSPEFQRFASFAAQVAKTMGATFAFLPRHAPEPGKKQRDVRLTVNTGFAFPCEMQELAFVLPNSTFESPGADWGEVEAVPSLRTGRTVPSVIGDVAMPAHEMSVAGSGLCLLNFNNVPLGGNAPPSAGALYENAAFAFASEFLSRFQWIADERRRSTIDSTVDAGAGDRFELHRLLAPRYPFTEVEPRLVASADDLVPHEIRLSNLDYNKIASLQLDNPELTPSMAMFPSGLAADVAEVAWGEDETVATIVKDRLDSWNREEGMTTGMESATRGLAGENKTEHAFTTTADGIQMIVTIVLTRPPSRTSNSDVELMQKLRTFSNRYEYPTRLTVLPLYQRFRRLMTNPSAIALMKTASSRARNAEDLKKFVDQCAHHSVLPLLLEFMAVIKRIRDIVDFYVPRGVGADSAPTIDSAAGVQIDELFGGVKSAVARSTKISEYINERMGWDVTDPRWTSKGGTPPPRATLSIKLAVAGGAGGGRTPPSWGLFEHALQQALGRLQIDP